MMAEGELVRPYPSMFVEKCHWEACNPPERMKHVMKTLARERPSIVFAGLSAAVALGLEHSYYLHRQDSRICIAKSSGLSGYCDRVRTMYVSKANIAQAVMANGFRVTSPLQTLFDCGRHYEFRDAVGLFDSALRTRMLTRDQILEYCEEPRHGIDRSKALRVARFANGLSENGGESFCYATMEEEGLMLPEQQVEFTDPNDTSAVYRIDYLWRLNDGRMIGGEFDGQQKYTDPSMTNGRSLTMTLDMERRRQRALETRGITMVRWFFADALWRKPLVDKLVAAGVPMRDAAQRLG